MKSKKIFGPPGTGKTSEALHIIESFIASDISADRIAYFTFTRAARQEAITRMEQKFGLKKEKLPYFATIHSLCYKQSGLSKEAILSKKDIEKFAKQIGIEIRFSPLITEEGFPIYSFDTDAGAALSFIDIQKSRCLPPNYDYYNGAWNQNQLDWFVQEYNKFKEENFLHDFSDLLIHYINSGNILPVDIIIVDEAQDISALQAKVIEKFCWNAKYLYLLGDDDQGIFDWAGANSDIFLQWKTDESIVLSHSYRLPNKLVEFSHRIISRVKNRQIKQFSGNGEVGKIYEIESIQDIENWNQSTFVLYRNKYQGDRLLREFPYNVPYKGLNSPLDRIEVMNSINKWEYFRKGGKIKIGELIECLEFSQHKEVLRELRNMDKFDSISITDTVLPIESWQQILVELPGYDRIKHWDVTKILVEFKTMHQSKGKESDIVIVCSDVSTQSYKNIDSDSEHKVFYTAVTRTKQELYILQPSTSKYYSLER